MREDLAAAVAGVLAGIDTTPIELTEAETECLLAAADLVTLARTAVEHDRRGEVAYAHAPEMPTRFAKQLSQVVRGAVAIGVDRADAMRLAIRCARDSVPPMRLAIIDDLAENPHSSTTEVRKRIDKPHNSTDRQLQALHMLNVVTVAEVPTESPQEQARGVRTRWLYALRSEIDPNALRP